MKTIQIRDDLEFKLALEDAMAMVSAHVARDQERIAKSVDRDPEVVKVDEIYQQRWQAGEAALQTVIDLVSAK